MRPMLATRGDVVPQGDGWTHEVKWDGIRALIDTNGAAGRVRISSRNDNDITASWPDVAAGGPDHDALIDGEIIALNDAGIPDFRTLQARLHVRQAKTVRDLAARLPVTFMAFDLLRLDGRDLTGEPLRRRRELLAETLVDRAWQVPVTYDDGPMLFDATRQQGLEGIVSKRLDSRYRPGERSKDWLKFAHRVRDSYVVGGWAPQQGTTDRLAALLVGQPTPEGLLYRGRVGSGIGGKQSRLLSELVAGLGRGDSAFADEVPRVDRVGVKWLEPALVIEVESLGHGYDRLRQPAYKGVRTDVTADDLIVIAAEEA